MNGKYEAKAASQQSRDDVSYSASAAIRGQQLERQLSRALQLFDHRQAKISGCEPERLLLTNGYPPFDPRSLPLPRRLIMADRVGMRLDHRVAPASKKSSKKALLNSTVVQMGKATV